MKRGIGSTLLIVFGIILMLSSFGLKFYSKKKESNLVNKLDKEFNNEYIRNKNKNSEKIVEKRKVDIGDGIAIMQIPSISLKTVIVEGIEKEQIRYYVGHFTDSVMPGEEGNFSIAGHSSHIYNELLNELYKVNVGDDINIRTLTKEFKYKIEKKFIVEPTEVRVLDQIKNEKVMTIVTCTEKGNKRLIVKAKIQK
ncbi:class D sortase [Hathewaya histolytica]|uniref:class D sortase n=1 Tax=Hathewaya histolytica TaxID=1498 RepID=UPI003B6748AB